MEGMEDVAYCPSWLQTRPHEEGFSLVDSIVKLSASRIYLGVGLCSLVCRVQSNVVPTLMNGNGERTLCSIFLIDRNTIYIS